MYRIILNSKLFEILQQVCRLLSLLWNITSTKPTIITKFGLRQLRRYSVKLLTTRFGAGTLGGTRPDRPWAPSRHRLQWESFRCVAQTTHPHLWPMLKKSIFPPVLPLFACMAPYLETFILPKLFRHHANGIRIKYIKFAKSQKKHNGDRNEA